MASRTLVLINAQTKQEMKLVKQNGVYKSNGDVFVGDLYRDPTNPDFAIIDVNSKLHPEDLDAIVQHHLVSQATPGTNNSSTSIPQ